MAEECVKSLLEFFQHVNARYVVSTTRDLDEKIETLMNNHLGSMKKLGNFSLSKIFLISENPKLVRPLCRKLLTFDSKYIIPTRPTPLAPNPNQPSQAFAPNSPLPPLIGNISPPFAPEMAPSLFNPISPSYGPHFPPCIPSHGGVGGPVGAPAIGGGGLHGSDGLCYWQKTKSIGGTCGFGGTAMLINSDPNSTMSLAQKQGQTSSNPTVMHGHTKLQPQKLARAAKGCGPPIKLPKQPLRPCRTGCCKTRALLIKLLSKYKFGQKHGKQLVSSMLLRSINRILLSVKLRDQCEKQSKSIYLQCEPKNWILG
ncbi:hypothetical protein BC332_24488 [Capsicum chinense]|nr:hypothetical protein BC332_24488 [Capsicum chinense]